MIRGNNLRGTIRTITAPQRPQPIPRPREICRTGRRGLYSGSVPTRHPNLTGIGKNIHERGAIAAASRDGNHRKLHRSDPCNVY